MGGWLIDRLPVPYVAASAQAIALIGAIALTVMPSPEMAILTLGSIGVGYGLISGVTAGAVAAYWPKVEFGRIASRTYVAWCLAAISLPVLAGRLYDLTGGYETAVIVAGGANLLAVLVALTLPRQSALGNGRRQLSSAPGKFRCELLARTVLAGRVGRVAVASGRRGSH